MTRTNFPENVLPTGKAMDMSEPQTLDKRLVQERNRTAVLHWLWRFGWLTSRMISALVWPDATYSVAMTRRTLQQLVDEKLIIARAMTKGGTAYLLAAEGARLLSEQCGVDASSGNSLTIGNAVHRACSNWYLIRAVQRGLDIVTEHEIVTERGPYRVLHGKQADGIVIAEGGACVWVECENAKKGRTERHKTCALVQSCLGQVPSVELAPGLWLARVAVVATNEQALRWMAASFQQFHRDGLLSDGQVGDVDACLLPLTESMVPGESVEGNMYWDILLPAAA
ncbi:hypothetical protein [Massilia sp. BKSP1R2A-1]|uniref:hypothetical protein n=1 Tax=Massilia sp. BKSP1R2A-1 TaxID=3422595 RepID=UPI003D3466A4